MQVRNILAACGLAVVAASPSTQTQETLYVCVDQTNTLTIAIGITICDAAPTEALQRRLDEDHLHLRPGALVTEVAEDTVAQVAGLQSDDVIYRVGGINVGDQNETNAHLELIQDTADTVVNFLRDGRPYLVRLRRP